MYTAEQISQAPYESATRLCWLVDLGAEPPGKVWTPKTATDHLLAEDFDSRVRSTIAEYLNSHDVSAEVLRAGALVVTIFE